MGLNKLAASYNPGFDPKDRARALAKDLASTFPGLQVYLFGSAASGRFTEDSDLDLLLVYPDGTDLAASQKTLYSKRWTDIAVDFICVTQEQFDKKKNLGGICFESFHYGMKLI